MTDMALSADETKRFRADFARRGFVVVPGVLSPGEIPVLREVLEEKLDRSGRTDLPAPEFISDERLSDIPFRPKAVRVLRALLGDDYVTIPEYTATSGKYVQWHRDINSQGHVDHLYDPDFAQLECAIYLQDASTEVGGGLEVVPRSHYAYSRLGGVQSFFSRGLRRAVCGLLPRFVIPSKAGDLVLFHFRLLHRAAVPSRPAPVKKLSIFWGASRNNRHVGMYMDHLRTRSSEAIQDAVSRVKYPDTYHPTARGLIVGQQLHLPEGAPKQ